jgi:hypothetical protein
MRTALDDSLPQLLCFVPAEIWRCGVPGARLQEAIALGRDGRGLVRADMRSIFVVIAALAVGFALKSDGTHGIGLANAGLQAEPPGILALGAILLNSLGLAVSAGSQIPDGPGVRAASLETEVASESAVEETKRWSEPSSARTCASFNERFYFDGRLASFDERFAGAAVSPRRDAAAEVDERWTSILLPPPGLGEHAKGRPAVAQSAPEPAPVTSSPLASVYEKRLRTAEARNGLTLPPDADAHTAIYDIAARTVYLPSGHRLEAHSGLGSRLDDPRHVNVKGQGPTPPNLYGLALRERLFHGVRAIRLTPVDDGKMFGRDGILAHSYMLGPNGQSNGCVSFSNYPAFLQAFLRGEVDRLVVVDHLATTHSAKTSATNGG